MDAETCLGGLDGDAVAAFHDACLSRPGWASDDDGERAPAAGPVDGDPLAEGVAAAWRWIAENHRCNARLWAHEDQARRRDLPDADIVAHKRAIDALNQRRNDAIERLDESLLGALGGLPQPVAHDRPPLGVDERRLRSETPAQIVDRMSIAALRRRSMAGEVRRTDADAAHRALCAQRLDRIDLQRRDLGACLDALLRGALAGHCGWRVYRQFKMYNDPATNPWLRRAAG